MSIAVVGRTESEVQVAVTGKAAPLTVVQRAKVELHVTQAADHAEGTVVQVGARDADAGIADHQTSAIVQARALHLERALGRKQAVGLVIERLFHARLEGAVTDEVALATVVQPLKFERQRLLGREQTKLIDHVAARHIQALGDGLALAIIQPRGADTELSARDEAALAVIERTGR